VVVWIYSKEGVWRSLFDLNFHRNHPPKPFFSFGLRNHTLSGNLPYRSVLFVERSAPVFVPMSVRPPPQKKPQTEPSSTTDIPPPNPQPAFASTPGRLPIQQRPPPGLQQQQGNGQQQVRPPFQLGRPPPPGGVRPQMMGTPQQQSGMANGGGVRPGQQQGNCKFPRHFQGDIEEKEVEKQID